MKKKITVTSNPAITMYGSGACEMMKKVIDVTVSAYKKRTNKYNLFNDY